MSEEIVRIYSELKRRKVIRVGMFYAIGGWVLLQIGEVTFEPLEVPSWAMRSLIYTVVACFPLALVLASNAIRWTCKHLPANNPVLHRNWQLIAHPRSLCCHSPT